MKNIFVGNLSFGATEDSIRWLFEKELLRKSMWLLIVTPANPKGLDL